MSIISHSRVSEGKAPRRETNSHHCSFPCSLNKGKLGGPSDGLIGIFNDDLIATAKADYEKDYLINQGVEFKNSSPCNLRLCTK